MCRTRWPSSGRGRDRGALVELNVGHDVVTVVAGVDGEGEAFAFAEVGVHERVDLAFEHVVRTTLDDDQTDDGDQNCVAEEADVRVLELGRLPELPCDPIGGSVTDVGENLMDVVAGGEVCPSRLVTELLEVAVDHFGSVACGRDVEGFFRDDPGEALVLDGLCWSFRGADERQSKHRSSFFFLAFARITGVVNSFDVRSN